MTCAAEYYDCWPPEQALAELLPRGEIAAGVADVTSPFPGPVSADWPVYEPTPELALDLWQGPRTERCDDEVTDVSIYRAQHAEVDWLCNQNAAPYQESSGCFKRWTAMPFLGNTEPRPWVIAEIYGELPTSYIVAHELTHWLFLCSGMDADDDHEHELFDATVEAMRVELGGAP